MSTIPLFTSDDKQVTRSSPGIALVDWPAQENFVRSRFQDGELIYACVDIVMWIKNLDYISARNMFNHYKSIGHKYPQTWQPYAFPQTVKAKAMALDGKMRSIDFIAAKDIRPLLRILGRVKMKRTTGYVYLIRCGWKDYENVYKIGFTTDLRKRLDGFSQSFPFPTELIASILIENPKQLEAKLHDEFKHQRIRKEWFALKPENVEYICNLLNE